MVSPQAMLAHLTETLSSGETAPRSPFAPNPWTGVASEDGCLAADAGRLSVALKNLRWHYRQNDEPE